MNNRLSYEEQYNREVEKNRAILEGCSDAVVTINQRGIVEFFNKSSEKLWGYDRNEVIGKNVKILTPPEYAKDHDQYIARYLKTGEAKVIGIGREVEALNKEGMRIPVLLTLSKAKIKDEYIFTAFVKNISEGNAAKDRLEKINNELELFSVKLAKQKTLFESLFKDSPYGIFLKDTQRNIIMVNPAFTQLTGYAQNDIEGKNSSVLYENIQEYDRLEKERFNLEAEEKLKPYEVKYRKKNGGFFISETVGTVMKSVAGESIGYLGIINDISARKVVEEKLRKLSLVASKTDNSILITDRNGLIEWVNDGFTRQTGYSLGEVVGKKPGTFLQGPETDMKTCKRIRKNIDAEISFTDEILNYGKDGNKYWIRMAINPVFNEEGVLEKFIAIQSNITQQKEFEKELKNAKSKAESSKLAKEQFLANMSHEIRTPMNAILGVSELLSKTELNDKQRKFMDTIMASGENLLVIINDILDLSKIDAGEMIFEKVGMRIRKVIESVISIAILSAEEKGIVLECKCLQNDVDLILKGDPVRMNQILLNLINNAIKFTPAGRVDLIVERTFETVDHIGLRFCVKDTGIGIEEGKLNTIFSNFQQAEPYTTRKYGGTGLGLAIVKNLVELQGGKVEVTSKQGEGSMFCFELSFEKGAITDLIDEYSSQPVIHKNALKGYHILLAEDVEFNRFVIENMATEWACKLTCVDNGAKAVEEVRKGGYHLVLMDVQMPVMGGVEATKLIRKLPGKLKDTPVIALTANAIKSVLEEYLEEGMDSYVTKPFKPDVLLRTIMANLKILPEFNADDLENINKASQTEPLTILYDLTGIEDMAKGNKVFIHKMIRSFIDQSKETAMLMKDLAQKGNFEPLGKLAHKIKPSFNVMGIHELHKMIIEIERLAEEQDKENSISTTSIFSDKLDIVISGLEGELEKYL